MPVRPIAYRNTLTAIVACASCVEDYAYHFDEPTRFRVISREPTCEDGSESLVVVRRVADGKEATVSAGTSYPEDVAEGIVNAREFFIPLDRPRESACAECRASLRSGRRKSRAA